MKLRIRSLDSNQSLQLELSDISTVDELKKIISSRLSDDGFSVSPNRLFLTFNSKNELSGSSLHSHGVISGDLIFYSINPNPDDGMCFNGGGNETLSPHKQVDYVAILQSLSVPNFLKKVFDDEIRDNSSRNNMLLNVAVHAVLLESGFVVFDPVSSAKVDGFRLSHGLLSSALHYTIPEALSGFVCVKFQSMGRFVNVVGSLIDKVFVYRVCLDGSRLLPAFNLVRKNGNNGISVGEDAGGNLIVHNPDKDVFEFWMDVKDGIALPLLIDLCESVGLVPPSCFMLLSADLKLKILELLSGTDIASIACVCRELRSVSSNDGMWKRKYGEEFGNDTQYVENESSWNIRFSMSRKRRKTDREFGHRLRMPFGMPYMFGGDFHRPRRTVRMRPNRCFSPCS